MGIFQKKESKNFLGLFFGKNFEIHFLTLIFFEYYVGIYVNGAFPKLGCFFSLFRDITSMRTCNNILKEK